MKRALRKRKTQILKDVHHEQTPHNGLRVYYQGEHVGNLKRDQGSHEESWAGFDPGMVYNQISAPSIEDATLKLIDRHQSRR